MEKERERERERESECDSVRDTAEAVEIVYLCTLCVQEEEEAAVHRKDVVVVAHPKTNTAPVA